jgi:hypothetical protein
MSTWWIRTLLGTTNTDGVEDSSNARGNSDDHLYLSLIIQADFDFLAISSAHGVTTADRLEHSFLPFDFPA